jgi:hypothetical protein
MAELPPPPDYACAPVLPGDLPHPALALTEVTFEQAAGFAGDVASWSAQAVTAGVMSADHARFERSYLANLRLYQFYGASFWLAANPAGDPVTLHVAKPGRSPRRNAWGRYVNHYLAFTHPARRRQGYATAAELELQAGWHAQGYDRLKTLCQSWLGFCYHEHLRDRMWGVNQNGELIIDSPLDPAAPFPPGVPIKARNGAWNLATELLDEDIMAILTRPGGRFRRAPAEVQAVLAKRAFRRADQGGPQQAMQQPRPAPGVAGSPRSLEGSNPSPSAAT